MKQLITENCGGVEFVFEMFGHNIQKLNESGICEDGLLYSLDSGPDFLDCFTIYEDKKDISLRFVFMQMKPAPSLNLSEFPDVSSSLLYSLPQIHKKQEFLADVLLEFANLCLEKKCALKISAMLLRPDERIEPISDEDRKAGGLAGIPLELIQDSKSTGITEFIARTYSGGMPPLLLIKEDGITFPNRSWYPAGLVPGWSPWKQNVEFQVHDRMVFHTEFKGSREDLEQMHQWIMEENYSLPKNVSMVIMVAKV